MQQNWIKKIEKTSNSVSPVFGGILIYLFYYKVRGEENLQNYWKSIFQKNFY